MQISLLNSNANVPLANVGREGIVEGSKASLAFEEGGTLSFGEVMDGLASGNTVLHASQQFSSSLNGDYLSSFQIKNPTHGDMIAAPQGVARGFYKEYSSEGEISCKTIDKTSVLYEKALELESYFVKIMTDSMRSTLSNSTIAGNESFASKMYKDMMYEELNRNLTKHAGFGLADHIYLQLKH